MPAIIYFKVRFVPLKKLMDFPTGLALRPKKKGPLKKAPFYVRPAGRTHLEVEVLYRPGRGNC
jgi:hypothetical protein